MSAMAAQHKRAVEGQGGSAPPAKRDFLDMSSLTEGELNGLLALAARLKLELKSGIEHPYLRRFEIARGDAVAVADDCDRAIMGPVGAEEIDDWGKVS